MPLGEEVALHPLEPPDDLVHQAADLGEVAPDRPHLLGEAVADGVLDLRRNRCLELGRGLRQLLDLSPRALERRVQRGRVGTSFGGLAQPLSRLLDCLVSHGRQR